MEGNPKNVPQSGSRAHLLSTVTLDTVHLNMTIYIAIKSAHHPMTFSEPLDKSRSALYLVTHVSDTRGEMKSPLRAGCLKGANADLLQTPPEFTKEVRFPSPEDCLHILTTRSSHGG